MAGGRAALLAQPRITPNQWTGSPQITALRNRLAESEIELAGMRRALTAKHPAVISAMARIDETIRRLDAEVGKGLQPQVYGVDPVYQQLALQVKDADLARAALVPRERALEAAIQRYEERLRSLPPREAELAGLTRRVREAESLTLLLTGKLQEASTLEASIGSTVAVVDSPKVLDKPVRPQRPLYAGLAALVGLMIGIAGVYAAEQIDDRFHSVADVERSLGPVVATVPQLTDGQSPDIPLTMTLHDRHGAPFAEAFRHLRTRILVSRYPPLRTILVTSPGPGEGKDSVAANLAIALSQAGRRVWLVECDLRRPALARAFHADVTVGLADLLMNGLPVEQALLRTSVENLWLLPSGPPPTNPAELLAGPKMRSLLVPGNAEDFVIIDATPTLPVADAAELAAVTDGILLVVRLGKTPKAAARRALQELEVVGGRVVGIVVNGVSTRNPHGYDYTPYYPFGQTPRGALRHS